MTYLHQLQDLPNHEKKDLSQVEAKFAFRTNSYNASLINWDDRLLVGRLSAVYK
jgi:L-lysine 2,3-aminomutase